MKAILDYWPLITFSISLLGVWSALLFGALKWFMNREVAAMDKRFARLDEILKDNQEDHEANTAQHYQISERIHALRTDLGENYVKQEAWVRLELMLDRKFADVFHKVEASVKGVHERLDKILLEGKRD
jgi:hypothetical protein